MRRGKYKIFKWIGWVLGSFFALILIITVSFYLGRGWLMKRAVIYLNENQPGEVHIRQMNLFPLMDFPNSVVQFRDITWYENPVRPDSLPQEPILSLDELNLSLDIVELIRGDIKVDQFRLKNGFVRIVVYPDSLMNLEKALGIRFGEGPSQPKTTDSLMRIVIDKIELINIHALYQDHTSGDALNIQINLLESQFSLLPHLVDSDVELNVDINSIKYQKYNIENKKNVILSSHILFDLEKKSIVIEPSFISISGLELETWGNYEFLGEPMINIAFRATNTGLDVLNFLFLGILDLDEIEQIGSGSIHLDGSVTGVLGKQVPVIRLNVIAQGIGFRIKPIERDVSDISFTLYATNGAKADFSEGQVELTRFTASFPEGTVHGDIMAKNLVRPEIDLELKGELVLDGLDHMIEMEMLRSVEGHISFDFNFAGMIDRSTNRFPDEAGSMTISMDRVGVVYGKDTLSRMNGTLYMDGSEIGTRGLHLVFNGSQAALEVKTQNILQYMLDYDKDVDIEIALASDRILLGRMTRDSLITGLLGEEITGLHFKAQASITGKELDAFLERDTIPAFNFTLDSFGIEIPVYANISDLNGSLAFDTDTLTLHYLNGNIGESGFSFSGRMVNLEAFINKDSGEIVGFDYNLSSPRLRAEDLFSYKSGFLLPENYRSEHMEDFHLTGSAQFPVEALIYDSVDLDFGVEITNMGWHFRYYPMAIEQFRVKVNKQGKALRIDNLEGNIGESNLKLTALIGNYADSSLENLYGNLNLKSDLLDFNQLLNYQLPDEMIDTGTADSSEILNPPRLDQMEFPDFTFNLDVGELRYGENTIYGVRGTLRSTTEKVLFIDSLVVSAESGGSLGFNGQFNVANPLLYNFSTQMEMKDVNITDLNFQMQSGEEVYTLKENFEGILSGSGLAEIFMTPDLNLDMEKTTALFQLEVRDGALINFTPLKAAGQYLNTKDLDYVRFSTLRNSFTLMDSRIIIPLMVVESTIGQMLIEGEQGLDNTYLYLLRVPPWLVKDAARSVFRKKGDDEKEDEIRKMKMGNFVMMTIWSDGVESGVEWKDQREKYRK